MPRRRLLSTACASASVILGLAALAGCGSSTTGGAQPEPGGAEHAASATPLAKAGQPAGAVVHVGIHGEKVSSDHDRVELDRSDPVTLVISADEPGELHVHSTPEQHVEYPKGRSSVTLRFDQPGVIDVESHALDALIVQLEVR